MSVGRRLVDAAMRQAAAALAALACAAVAAAAEAPGRIASLNLAADEVLVEILPPGRLVAVTRFADDPRTSPAAGRVPPSVYRFAKADLERLVALAPDLVVVSQYTDADVLELIEKTGLRYHRMDALDTLPGIRAAVLRLGEVVGEPAAARRLAARMDRVLDELARRLEGARRPRVLYWSGTMTAGAGTTIGAVIEAAGGVNVGRELGIEGIAPPGEERAFVADPDVVLVTTWPGIVESLRSHPLFSQMRAVRERRIAVMPNELVVTLSHHVADSCWQLAHRLHPDRVPAQAPP